MFCHLKNETSVFYMVEINIFHTIKILFSIFYVDIFQKYRVVSGV